MHDFRSGKRLTAELLCVYICGASRKAPGEISGLADCSAVWDSRRMEIDLTAFRAVVRGPEIKNGPGSWTITLDLKRGDGKADAGRRSDTSLPDTFGGLEIGYILYLGLEFREWQG